MPFKSKLTVDEKCRIVMELLTTGITTAELCHKHNITPRTLYQWKERFVEGGRTSLGTSREGDKEIMAENERLKKLIGELTLANDAFKKTLEGRRRQ